MIRSLFGKILIGGLMLISSVSMGLNFSGHWVANSGKVSSNIGLNSPCSKVEILIQHTDDQIRTEYYKSDCQMFGAKWGPVVQNIKDGKVFENGVEVGTITEDTLMTTSTSGTYKYAYNLKLKVSDEGELILNSYYGTQGAIGAMATEAQHQLSAQ